jgi:HNH endonuclease
VYDPEAQQRYRSSEKYRETRARWKEQNPGYDREAMERHRRKRGVKPRDTWDSRGVPEHVVQDCGYKTPCWVWQRSVQKGRGYGKITVGSKKLFAHRVVWERHKGPIPEGLELDHLCRNPPCVNPDHLEPVTHAINMKRGNRWNKPS